MNNKDKREELSVDNTDNDTYVHIHKPDLECKHSKTGYCGDECILMDGEKCPYEDKIK